MVIEACRAMLTERFRLMCKQRGRQQLVGSTTSRIDIVNDRLRKGDSVALVIRAGCEV